MYTAEQLKAVIEADDVEPCKHCGRLMYCGICCDGARQDQLAWQQTPEYVAMVKKQRAEGAARKAATKAAKRARREARKNAI